MRSMLWRKTKRMGRWKAAVSGAWAWGVGWGWAGLSKGKVSLGAKTGEETERLQEGPAWRIGGVHGGQCGKNPMSQGESSRARGRSNKGGWDY